MFSRKYILILLVTFSIFPLYQLNATSNKSASSDVDNYSLISFSHRFHIDEIGADCMDCHSNYKRPKMQVCSSCHSETEDDAPVSECMKCHMRADYGSGN